MVIGEESDLWWIGEHQLRMVPKNLPEDGRTAAAGATYEYWIEAVFRSQIHPLSLLQRTRETPDRTCAGAP
ncbi:MAG TPA: hypothetical protein DDY88_08955 [Actinobacteria bacterium]|nr:hypothetical protein [Actinomycetota bacterium]